MNSDFKEGLRKMGNLQVRYKSIKEHRLSALLVKRKRKRKKVLVIMVTKLMGTTNLSRDKLSRKKHHSSDIKRRHWKNILML